MAQPCGGRYCGSWQYLSVCLLEEATLHGHGEAGATRRSCSSCQMYARYRGEQRCCWVCGRVRLPHHHRQGQAGKLASLDQRRLTHHRIAQAQVDLRPILLSHSRHLSQTLASLHLRPHLARPRASLKSRRAAPHHLSSPPPPFSSAFAPQLLYSCHLHSDVANETSRRFGVIVPLMSCRGIAGGGVMSSKSLRKGRATHEPS